MEVTIAKFFIFISRAINVFFLKLFKSLKPKTLYCIDNSSFILEKGFKKYMKKS